MQLRCKVREFRAAIDGRLNAMAKVHEWMVAARGVEIHTLTAEHLEPYAGDRLIQDNGPIITLSPDCARSMSMAMHELATNAVNYGALSTIRGKLDIQRDVARQANGEP
jgi:two-component sensor histidine kinase